MISSTLVALKSQGLPTKSLTQASSLAFDSRGLYYSRSNIEASTRFWCEFVSSRAAFREKTGINMEEAMAE